MRTTTHDARVAETVAKDIRALIGEDLGRSNDDWQNTAERLGRNLQDIGASLTAASRGADRTRPARLIGWIADGLVDAIGEQSA